MAPLAAPRPVIVSSHLIGIAATAVLVRVILLATRSAPDLVRLEPWTVAEALASGRGFVFEQYGAEYLAWKEPLYIALVAALQWLAGPTTTPVVGSQIAFGAATAVAVALLARRFLASPGGVTVAGLLTAVNPFLAYYDTHFVHPLSFDSLLFVTTSASVIAAVRATSPLRAGALTGLVTAVGLWQRATLLLAAGAMWVVGVVTAPAGERGRGVRTAAVWLVVCALLISPWLIRNYRLFDRVLFTTDFAHIVWLGNNPWSNGTYSDAGGTRVFFRADPSFRRTIEGAPELVQYERFLAEARRFIVEEPASYARLTLSRLHAFVWFSPNAGVTYTASEQHLYTIFFALLLAFGVTGLMLTWKDGTGERRRDVLLLVASVAGIAIVHALTAINLKHRVPLELVLSIFAADPASRVLGWAAARRPRGRGALRQRG